MAADNFQLAQLQPLFSMAIKNALDDLDYQVQAIIKEKCTAIHPSVEWRFHQVAHEYLMA
jgi:chemotaxis response regulator CheB